jgi:serine protease inhibitor
LILGVPATKTGADLFISDINHKTYIKLDEEGTEAAAVTSIGVSVTSMPPVITINRPYLIVIREEKTGALLFIGRIMNPLG